MRPLPSPAFASPSGLAKPCQAGSSPNVTRVASNVAGLGEGGRVGVAGAGEGDPPGLDCAVVGAAVGAAGLAAAAAVAVGAARGGVGTCVGLAVG
jgi:hypothetical protein